MRHHTLVHVPEICPEFRVSCAYGHCRARQFGCFRLAAAGCDGTGTNLLLDDPGDAAIRQAIGADLAPFFDRAEQHERNVCQRGQFGTHNHWRLTMSSVLRLPFIASPTRCFHVGRCRARRNPHHRRSRTGEMVPTQSWFGTSFQAVARARMKSTHPRDRDRNPAARTARFACGCAMASSPPLVRRRHAASSPWMPSGASSPVQDAPDCSFNARDQSRIPWSTSRVVPTPSLRTHFAISANMSRTVLAAAIPGMRRHRRGTALMPKPSKAKAHKRRPKQRRPRPCVLATRESKRLRWAGSEIDQLEPSEQYKPTKLSAREASTFAQVRFRRSNRPSPLNAEFRCERTDMRSAHATAKP